METQFKTMMDGFQVQWNSYAELQSPPPQILMSPGGLGWDPFSYVTNTPVVSFWPPRRGYQCISQPFSIHAKLAQHAPSLFHVNDAFALRSLLVPQDRSPASP